MKSAGTGATRPAKKRVVASLFSEPPGFQRELTNPVGTTGSAPGLAELQQLIHGGLATLDDDDLLRAHLAEAVPSVENGLWTIEPDGRMQTTWRIRPGVTWHDGKPFTADDLQFTVEVGRDREIGIVNLPAFDLIESVHAPDPQTVVVRWHTPFIEADSLFSPGLGMPLPRHLLAGDFIRDKAGFLGLPYWSEAYVGTGAYRLQEWTMGSGAMLVANDNFVFGRPRIDEIEVRFVTDMNTVTANLLAGTIDIPLGRGIRPEHALQLREMSRDLNIVVGKRVGSVLPIFPQFINPQPAIVSNVALRQALLHALNRTEMDDTINFGLGGAADTWLPRDRPEFKAIEGQIVRYAYDPRRATELVESLGYTRGSDGNLRDAVGGRLILEVRTTEQNATQAKAVFPIADYWRRIGVDAEPLVVPNQRVADREYRAQFPAFEVLSTGLSWKSNAIRLFAGTSAPLPENRFQGGNRARYVSPALDAMIDRYVSTIPYAPRMAALGDIIQHQTEHLTLLPTFYLGVGRVHSVKRVHGVTADNPWNAHLWDVD